ncbi:hypothetical protein B4U37_08070 [Sutcliffiella horikoshii]|uniref:Uncharacterized protein n=1 Tax=Sutcliffiella horikoshii TaxID=79883 RepID=A0ABN4ZIC4_9BACI|nr:hypothetical protein B4U37_08070 [Sutcliffiella horikoshii]
MNFRFGQFQQNFGQLLKFFGQLFEIFGQNLKIFGHLELNRHHRPFFNYKCHPKPVSIPTCSSIRLINIGQHLRLIKPNNDIFQLQRR